MTFSREIFLPNGTKFSWRAASGSDRCPGAFLITFTCYGTHLHGQEASVDRKHNAPGWPFLPADPARLRLSRGAMKDAPYELDTIRRERVVNGIRTACARRKWTLIAAHVRINHVHVIVRADRAPEDVMIALKAYASRALNEAGLDSPDRRR